MEKICDFWFFKEKQPLIHRVKLYLSHPVDESSMEILSEVLNKLLFVTFSLNPSGLTLAGRRCELRAFIWCSTWIQLSDWPMSTAMTTLIAQWCRACHAYRRKWTFQYYLVIDSHRAKAIYTISRRTECRIFDLNKLMLPKRMKTEEKFISKLFPLKIGQSFHVWSVDIIKMSFVRFSQNFSACSHFALNLSIVVPLKNAAKRQNLILM